MSIKKSYILLYASFVNVVDTFLKPKVSLRVSALASPFLAGYLFSVSVVSSGLVSSTFLAAKDASTPSSK